MGPQLWVCSVDVGYISHPTSTEQPAPCQPLTELATSASSVVFWRGQPSSSAVRYPHPGSRPSLAAVWPVKGVSLSFNFLISECTHCLSALWCRAKTVNGKYLLGVKSAPGIRLLDPMGSQGIHVSGGSRKVSASSVPGGRVHRWHSHKTEEGCPLTWDSVKPRDKPLLC